LTMAGFASMADLRAKEEEEKKKKGAGKGTEAYTGGHSSGMAVERPESDEEKWKRMEGNAATSASAPVPGSFQITMWKDGFTINDGPLRPTSDPLNKKFLDEIMAGDCPEELRAGQSDDVPVSVHDKRGEEYKEPTAVGVATAGRAPPAAPAKIDNPVSGGDATVTVDDSKPKTKIQIRFQDGSKKAQEFNEEQTVGDLRNFCKQVTGQAMTIKGGFPPKPLTDDSQTLKAAGLCGAAVTVMPA